MPLISDDIAPIPESVRVLMPEWIFRYTHLGYQIVEETLVIYKLPTVRECHQYHLAYLYNPVKACELLMERIVIYGLDDIWEMSPGGVGQLIENIIREHFPRDEKTFDLIEEQQHMFNTNLVHIVETYLRLINHDQSVWEMNMQEIVEKVGLAQAITGQSIRGKDERQIQKEGNRPRRQQPRRSQPAGTEA